MHRPEMVDNSISLPVLWRLTVDDKTGYLPSSGRPKSDVECRRAPQSGPPKDARRKKKTEGHGPKATNDEDGP